MLRSVVHRGVSTRTVLQNTKLNSSNVVNMSYLVRSMRPSTGLILSKNVYKLNNPILNTVVRSNLASFGQVSYLLSQHHYFSTTPDDKKKDEESKDKVVVVAKPNIVIKTLKSVSDSIKHMVMNPKQTWQTIKDEAHHYWVGSKLLWSEIKITTKILKRLLKGHEMTRRERRQLIRTSTDMFRLVPFAIFVIVPFMELLLPLALKLFPNMLPSTFEDSLKKEESLKKELQMRLAVAKFMQETLQEIADKKTKEGSSSAQEILEFVEKARNGEPISNEKVVQIASQFKDELTLPNISRPQLISMCKYMGLQTLGSDDFLRFQLRTKFRNIKEDDRRILWEGIDSLNTIELREACQERGMRSIGITQFRLKAQLQEWLQLSTHKNIPISLLIMSRAFSLTTSDDPEEVLKSSMSSLDSDTINEVVVASASAGEENTVDVKKRKIESLKFQEELIEEEIENKEEKQKKEKEKEAAAAAAAAVAAAAQIKVELKDETIQKVVENISKDTVAAPVAATNTAASATASPEQVAKESKPKELTIQEIQSLTDLARGSALYREKSELHVLQATIEALLLRAEKKSVPPAASSAASATVANVPEAANASTEKFDQSLTRLRSVLNNMLSKLQTQIDSTEKVVGDKFNVLDKDNDGQLSAEELKEAIVKLFRRNYSVAEAEQLVSSLDNDKDGKISLNELLRYIQQRKENLEGETVAPPVEENAGSRLVKEHGK